MHPEAFDTTQDTIVFAPGEGPTFTRGDPVRIRSRTPVAPHRMPFYLLGKRGTVERVLTPAGIDHADDGAGSPPSANLHYYRIAIPMTEIWPDYVGSPHDGLRVEVFETWLAGI